MPTVLSVLEGFELTGFRVQGDSGGDIVRGPWKLQREEWIFVVEHLGTFEVIVYSLRGLVHVTFQRSTSFQVRFIYIYIYLCVCVRVCMCARGRPRALLPQ